MTDHTTNLHEAAFKAREWASKRIAVYKADGASTPEAVERLHQLGELVLTTLPACFTPKADDRADRTRAHLIAVCKSVSLALDILDTNTLAEPVSTPAGKDEEGERGGAALVSSSVSAESSPAPVSQPAGAGAADGPRWPAGLHHGLVLRNIATGEERLFSEPIKGQYSVQTVAADRASCGEPWSTMPSSWSASEWAEVTVNGSPLGIAPALLRYDAPKARKPRGPNKPKLSAENRTVALPGMADVAPTPAPPPKRNTLADYAPEDAQFATWAAALSKSAGKAIAEGEVRTCFVVWQTDNCNEEKPNPAAAFWQHARKALVGG